MGSSMKSEKKLEEVTNVRAWKTGIDLIFAKNDILGILKCKVTEPSNIEGKKYEKDEITTMSIIVDSIKDHVIPYVVSLEYSNQMYDSLIGLYTITRNGQ